MPAASDPKLRLLVRHSADARDVTLAKELLGHLTPLERFAGLDVWTHDRIRAGDETRREIQRAIDQADVALLLLSADFFASDGLVDREVPRLLERHRSGKLRVVPVLLRSCVWDVHPWLKELDPLPKDREPIAARQGEARDRVLTELAREIVRLATPSAQEDAASKPNKALARAKRSAAKAGGDTYNITIKNSTVAGFGAGPGTHVSGAVTGGPTSSSQSTTGGSVRAAPAAFALGDVWGFLDPDLQDAFTLALNHCRRAGSTSIGTRDFFAALARLQPEPLRPLLERLPKGALPSPLLAEPRSVTTEMVQQATLSPCVQDSLRFLSRDREEGETIPARDVFVDIARYGTGSSVQHLRNYGVDRSKIDRWVDALGWQVPDRAETRASVYLAYGDEDLPFTSQLYEALEAAGVPVFFRHEHAVPGARRHRSARRSIAEYEHVILLCSERSLSARSVMSELDEMLSREFDEGAAERIIPILLDDFASTRWQPRHPDLRRAVLDRVPLDMKGAESDRGKFEKALRRLLGALKG